MDYLTAVGDFCVDKVTGASLTLALPAMPIRKANAAHPQGGYYVSNNLGTNVAEFVAFNRKPQ